jgi:hypothetical protein
MHVFALSCYLLEKEREVVDVHEEKEERRNARKKKKSNEKRLFLTHSRATLTTTVKPIKRRR